MKLELVKNWMTHDVITITGETTLPEAHKLMADYQIRRLPVMKDDCLNTPRDYTQPSHLLPCDDAEK